MPIDGNLFQRIQDAMLNAFDKASLRQMVRICLDERLEHITDSGNLRDVTFDLIEWADRQQRLDKLLKCIHQARPNSAEITALYHEAQAQQHGEPQLVSAVRVSCKQLVTIRGLAYYPLHVVYEDALDNQSSFAQNLGHFTEQLSALSGDYGVTIIHARTAAVDSDFLSSKNWSDAAESELRKTPGILITSKGLGAFDPRTDKWVYIHFGRRVVAGEIELWPYVQLLHDMAAVLANDRLDFFEAVYSRFDVLSSAGVAVLVSEAPNVYGISIDMESGAGILLDLINAGE